MIGCGSFMAGKFLRNVISNEMVDDGLYPEPVFADNWQAIIDKLSRSPFHTGQNDRAWQATVDWILKNSTNYVKILEILKMIVDCFARMPLDLLNHSYFLEYNIIFYANYKQNKIPNLF